MTDPPDAVTRVESAVLSAGVLARGDRVLAAVSGGPDSTALLLALWELRDALGVYLEVGHVNHGLRGEESEADEAFVVGLAEELGLAVRAARVCAVHRPGEGGPEEVARDARFAALREMARAGRLDRIALGHTATDRAETVLMNLLRGCGLEGLAAMPAAAGDLVRPLLAVTRADTAEYCAARGVVPRYDSANLDPSLLRNRVRLSLMPLLERDYQPGAAGSLLRLAEIAAAELEWTRPLVEEAYSRLRSRRGARVALGLSELAAMPAGLRWRVIRQAMAEVRGDLRQIGLEHVRALDDLVLGGAGRRAELPGLVAERTAEALVLRPPRVGPRAAFRATLAVPGRVRLPEAGLEVCSRLRPADRCDVARRGPLVAQLDAATVGSELVLRPPQAGDRFAPLGMSGTKKLQDFLVDKKIPRADREGVVVAATTEGEIVWVVGHRISERAKVTPATQTVAELEARPLESAPRAVTA